MTYVMNMAGDDFMHFILLAKEKEKEESIREQWLRLFPFMNMKILEFVPLKQYVDQCTGKNIDLRPANVIIEEILELHGLNGL